MSVWSRMFLSAAVLVSFSARPVAAFEPAVAEKPEQNRITKEEFFKLRAAQRYEIEANVTYASPGGTKLLLDAYVPKLAGPLPAVLVVHGGAWRTGSKSQLSKYARDLAARGMVCFAINYRLSPRHKFPAQLEDCRAALQWIREHAEEYKVDASRIGAIGYSAGGHLVALLGVTGKPGEPDRPESDTRLAVVCAGGAPCEFRDIDPDNRGLAFWLGGPPKQVPEKYKSASPMAFINKAAPPMFFYNGTNDLLVKYQQAKAMSLALKALGVETQFVELEGMGHLFTAIHPPTLEKAYDFLAKHLKADTLEP